MRIIRCNTELTHSTTVALEIGREHCPSQMTLVIGTSKKISKLVLADTISKSLADKISKNIGIRSITALGIY